MPKYRLIIDLATDRVIYFTQDVEQNLFSDNNSVMASYDNELPPGMTQFNCRNFKFVNQQLINTVEQGTIPLPLLELNREALQLFADEEFRKKTALFFLPVTEDIMKKEAESTLAGGWPGKWLELTRTSTEQTFRDLATDFLESYEKKLDLLYRLEFMKKAFKKEIDGASTNDQIFEIKARLSRALSGISFKGIIKNEAWCNSAHFNFTKELEDNWEAIQQEALGLLAAGHFLDHLQSRESSSDRGKIANTWKVFNLVRKSQEAHPELAPVTWGILSRYPEITHRDGALAYFSLAPAGTVIDPHRNLLDSRNRRRHQLCLTKPEDSSLEKIYLQVNGEKRGWQLGKLLSFDDSYLHDLKNLTTQDRLVLLFDSTPTQRPSPPMSPPTAHQEPVAKAPPRVRTAPP